MRFQSGIGRERDEVWAERPVHLNYLQSSLSALSSQFSLTSHYIFLPLVTTVDAEYSDENTKKGQILPIFACKDKYLNVNSAFVYIFLLDALISLLKQSQVTGLIGSFCAPVI